MVRQEMSTRHSPHRATASPGAGCQRGGLPTIPCCPEAVARSPGDHGPRTAVTSGLQLSEPDPEVASDWRPCAALSAACIPYPLTGMQRMPSVCIMEGTAWVPNPGCWKEEVWWELPPTPASQPLDAREGSSDTDLRDPTLQAQLRSSGRSMLRVLGAAA